MRGRVRREKAGRQGDVVVDEDDDRAARRRDPRIARRTAIGLGHGHVRDPVRRGRAPRFDERTRSIARPVIRDHDFERRGLRLERERIERAFEKGRTIAGCDDDGETDHAESSRSARARRSDAPT